MSTLVDERIVEMKFDNSNFEKNTKETLNTIQNLKSSLNFDGFSNSINKAVNSIDMNPITYGLEKSANSFSVLEIAAISAINNITNRLTNLGVKLVESLSIDNISSGWLKYGENVKSVGTLLAQDGNTAEQVNESLSKLMWFTDQTSYSYTDMVSNISKFTATGQKLEDSVQAMMGIANWAALSGQNAATASRAMYQLSQAMGQGTVKLMDYKSIQNANMDTAEFRENVLKTAVDMGYLVEKIEGVYVTTDKAIEAGKEFSQSQFTTQLSAGWFSSDVLMNTLAKYSSVVDKLYEDSGPNGPYATAAAAIEAYESELENAGTEEEKFGLKAFKAAQEARTFEDAINATKDAVSSGWLKTFEMVFGDYEESKQLWTALADDLWDVFAASGEARNNMLTAWKELGGRSDVFDQSTGAFWNLFYAIKSVTDTIKSAWQNVFGFKQGLEDEDGHVQEYANRLKNVTHAISEFSIHLKGIVDNMLPKMFNILRGVFSIGKFIAKLAGSIFNGIKPIFSIFSTAGGGILDILSDLGDKIANIVDTTDIFANVTSKLLSFVQPLTDKVKELISNISQSKGMTTFIDSITKVIKETNAGNRILSGFVSIFNILIQVATAAGKIFTQIVLPVITKMVSLSGGIISKLLSALIRFTANVMDIFVEIENYMKTGNRFQNMVDKLISLLKKIPAFLAPIVPLIKAIGRVLFNLLELIVELPKALSTLVKKVTGSSIGDIFKTLGETITGAVKAIGNALSGFKTVDTGGVDEFTNEITPKISPLQSLFEGLKSLFEGVWSVIKAVMPVLGAAFQLLGEGLKWVANALKNAFGNDSPMETIKKVFSMAFWAGIAVSIYNIVYIFRSFVDSLKLIFDGLGSVLDSKAMLQYAEAMKLFAISILLIVASLVLISSMNAEQLAKSLTVLTILVTGMVTVMKIFNKMFDTTATTFKGAITGFASVYRQATKIKNVAVLFLAFAGSLVILVMAMKVLATMSYEQITNSLVALISLVTIMVVVCKILSNQKRVMAKGAVGLMFFALAIKTLVTPIKKLGEMSEENLLQGLKALGIVMAMLVVVGKIFKIKNAAALTFFSSSLILLSSGLLILSTSMGVLSLIKPQRLWNVVGALSALLVVFALVSKIIKIGDTAKLGAFAGSLALLGVAFSAITASIAILAALPIAKAWNGVGVLLAFTTAMIFISKLIGIFSALKLSVFAVGMLELGKAMAIFAAVIVIFGTMEPDALKRGRETIQFFILAMAGIIKLVGILSSLKLTVFATGMILLGVAMMEFASVIAILGSMKPENLGKGIGAILGMITVLALLSKLTNIKGSSSMLVLGVALTTVAAGMLILTTALLAMGSINLVTLIKGFAALTATLAVLVVASKLLGPSVITLLALGAAFTMIATAALAFASALALITGLGAGAGLAIAALLEGLVNSIINLGPQITQALATIIQSLATALQSAMTNIFEMIYGIVDNLVTLLKDKGPDIIDTIVLLLTSLVSAISKNSPQLAKDLINILVNVLSALKDAAAVIFQDVLDIIYTLIDIITQNVPTIMDKLYVLVVALVDGIVNTVTKLIPKLVESGFDLIIGLIDGLGLAIEKNSGRIRTAMIDFCKHMWNAFLNFFGIHSPSTKAENAAGNIVAGLVRGIGKGVTTAVRSITDLAKKMLTGLQSFTKSFLEWGKNIVQGIWNGIKSVWTGFFSFWENIWNGIVGWFKKLFHINSPSRLFYDFGQYTVEGYQNGLEDGKDGVYDSMEDIRDDSAEAFDDKDIYAKYGEQINIALANALLDSGHIVHQAINTIIDSGLHAIDNCSDEFTESLRNLLEIMQSEIDEDLLVISPVLDLSSVKQGMSELNTITGTTNIDVSKSTNSALAAANAMKNSQQVQSSGSNSNSTVSSSNGENYTITFNITGPDPKTIAEEVDQRLQEFIERGHKQWA